MALHHLAREKSTTNAINEHLSADCADEARCAATARKWPYDDATNAVLDDFFTMRAKSGENRIRRSHAIATTHLKLPLRARA
jgi:hypothetical protein